MRLVQWFSIIVALLLLQMQPSRASAQSVSDLVLPDSTYSPATIVQTYTGTLTPADADADYFKVFHSKTYVSLGLSSAYFAVAQWQATSDHVADYVYQADVFPSADAAFATFEDGVKTVTQLENGDPSYCGMATDYSCRWATNIPPSKGFIHEYAIELVGNCVAEVAADRTQGDVPSVKFLETGANIFGQIMDDAAKAMKAVCNPQSPQNTSFVAYPPQLIAAADAHRPGDAHPVTAPKVKTQYMLVVEHDLNVAPINSTVKLTVQALLKKKTAFKHSAQDTVNKPVTDILDTYPLPDAFYVEMPITFKKPGSYTLKVTLDINGKTAKSTLKVKVKK